MQLPISPLCDRETTKRPNSQIGFIKFVVLPAFQTLGRFLPKVAEEVVPLIESNLDFWIEEAAEEEKMAKIEEDPEEAS